MSQLQLWKMSARLQDAHSTEQPILRECSGPSHLTSEGQHRRLYGPNGISPQSIVTTTAKTERAQCGF